VTEGAGVHRYRVRPGYGSRDLLIATGRFAKQPVDHARYR